MPQSFYTIARRVRENAVRFLLAGDVRYAAGIVKREEKFFTGAAEAGDGEVKQERYCRLIHIITRVVYHGGLVEAPVDRVNIFLRLRCAELSRMNDMRCQVALGCSYRSNFGDNYES